ncbi:hypothetical protein PYH72_07715 [Staphylococcus delphini]|uniref:hypothetical protein n=1 Tax=Staphylococcus delphini TaxID=53344 RepID=UPI0033651C40
MAKVILKIDGKNKTFTKKDMTLGIMKKRGEFEEKIEKGYGIASEIQEAYRKNRTILNKIEKVEKKFQDAETEEEINAIYDELEELQGTEDYKKFEKEVDKIKETAESDANEDFNIYDELATLLVDVFDNQFTYDDVMDGLIIKDNETPPEVYAKIFRSDFEGKQKKNTTKQQAKS